MPLGPGQRVIGDFLPAALRGEQMRAPLEHRHLGERLRLVVRRVRVLHDRRHQVVLTAGDEQQRGPCRIAVVDPGRLRPGLEVREHAVPENAARRGYVISLVQGTRLGLGERVGEGVAPLLIRKADRPVPVRRALEHRERRPDLRPRRDEDALGRRRVEGHSRSPETVVEQDLHKRAARRVAHEDRRRVERRDDRLQMRDDRRNCEPLDRRWVGVERLDLDLETRVCRDEDLVAPRLIVRNPVLPTARRQPEAVDQHDRIGLSFVVHNALPNGFRRFETWNVIIFRLEVVVTPPIPPIFRFHDRESILSNKRNIDKMFGEEPDL